MRYSCSRGAAVAAVSPSLHCWSRYGQISLIVTPFSHLLPPGDGVILGHTSGAMNQYVDIYPVRRQEGGSRRERRGGHLRMDADPAVSPIGRAVTATVQSANNGPAELLGSAHRPVWDGELMNEPRLMRRLNSCVVCERLSDV
jgi:hypothetical protein